MAIVVVSLMVVDGVASTYGLCLWLEVLLKREEKGPMDQFDLKKKNEREVLGVIHNIIDIVTIYGRSVMEFGGGGGYGGKEKSLRKMKMEFYLGFGLLR